MLASLATIALQVLSFLVASRVASGVRKRVGAACKAAGDKFKAQWKGALFIPVAAAIVGWVTNWIAVQMIFYPINYWGIPIKQWVLGTVYGCDVLSPLGAIGWQGIVPAKAARMAMEMVRARSRSTLALRTSVPQQTPLVRSLSDLRDPFKNPGTASARRQCSNVRLDLISCSLCRWSLCSFCSFGGAGDDGD